MQLCKQNLGLMTAARIEQAEAKLLALPQVDCPLTHHFADGICVREVVMPSGAVVIGHAHRFADLNILLAGRLTLLLEDGSLKELRAPQTFVGTPGRKIAFIHEAVTWQNIWPLRLADGRDLGTDIDAIEAHYLDKSSTWTADRAQRLALEKLQHQGDREDYRQFLMDFGWSEAEVRKISEDPSDLIPFPEGLNVKVKLGESPIHGLGLFATKNIARGDVIAPARIAGKRTPAGRFTNHSGQPNAEMVARPDGDIELVAWRTINGCRGGQPGEEITVDYRQALKVALATKGPQ